LGVKDAVTENCVPFGTLPYKTCIFVHAFGWHIARKDMQPNPVQAKFIECVLEHSPEGQGSDTSSPRFTIAYVYLEISRSM
jgi:hypothetical protein